LSRGSRGFSLIEVLVAFVIAAVALTAAARVFGTAARSASMVQARLVALSLAETKLAEAAVVESGAGSFGDGLSWRRSVVPYPVPDESGAAWAPYQVTVEVRRQHRPAVSLTSIRLARVP
jgi:general secretion pathway protein I